MYRNERKKKIISTNKLNDKIYIYAQNAIQKLAVYEGDHSEKWLTFQKNNTTQNGTFVFAFQLYTINKHILNEKDYIAEIYSMNNNIYKVKYDGEIMIFTG